ncbi:ASCH domain-containing protein [Pectobacterium carotovorum]|uniref:hypothetical protein n=1 Tax=Pectobacterium carotovorum TaxID=554 RepID=UPI0037FDEE8E
MKERGIIFNGEMVRATLSGQKTQTRWVVANVSPDNCLVLRKPTKTKNGVYTHVLDAPQHDLCPFGKVGDRLYVRETWGVVSHAFDDDGFMISWIPDRPATAIDEMPFGKGYYSGHAIYAADGAFTWGDDDGHEDGRSRWKPSIHMPRAASRILLEITDVRVERLNDISEEDARAEGVVLPECCHAYYHGFSLLWQSIYGEESWQANPWVWAITFKRIERD